MIKNLTATAGTNYIEIVWSVPKFLPKSYCVNVTCRLLYSGKEYKLEVVKATPMDTILTVGNLYPGSQCLYTLLAIYNEASIDDGITRTIFTLNASMCAIIIMLFTRCAVGSLEFMIAMECVEFYV